MVGSAVVSHIGKRCSRIFFEKSFVCQGSHQRPCRENKKRKKLPRLWAGYGEKLIHLLALKIYFTLTFTFLFRFRPSRIRRKEVPLIKIYFTFTFLFRFRPSWIRGRAAAFPVWFAGNILQVLHNFSFTFTFLSFSGNLFQFFFFITFLSLSL